MGYPVTGNRVQARSYKAAVDASGTASDLPAGVGARLRAIGHAVAGNRVQARPYKAAVRTGGALGMAA